MKTINDGGPAFPVTAIGELPSGTFDYGSNGMTLRDYFAAKAIGACIREIYESGFDPSFFDNAHRVERAAKAAYAMADEMIEARKS